MLGSPDPLGERLTLMWHDHFATAQSKVEDLALMRRQNETFRRLARAPFGELLDASIREPALLLYLDAPSNRKDHPNENLARELMELFTLGIGNFTEADVKEAARALTGWTVDDGAFREAPSKHDDGEKTLLGRKGRWAGADLLSILLDQPATARRIARRICGLFMGEGAVDESAIDGPGRRADGEPARRRPRGRDGAPLEGVLRPGEPRLEGGRAGRVRDRGLPGPGPWPGRCRARCSWPTGRARLGQELFEPPNVGGWPGGRAWLTARSLVGRANFAAALVEGRPVGLPAPLDAGVDRRRARARQIGGRGPGRCIGAAARDRASRSSRAAGRTNRPRLPARPWRPCSPRPRPRSADVDRTQFLHPGERRTEVNCISMTYEEHRP